MGTACQYASPCSPHDHSWNHVDLIRPSAAGVRAPHTLTATEPNQTRSSSSDWTTTKVSSESLRSLLATNRASSGRGRRCSRRTRCRRRSTELPPSPLPHPAAPGHRQHGMLSRHIMPRDSDAFQDGGELRAVAALTCGDQQRQRPLALFAGQMDLGGEASPGPAQAVVVGLGAGSARRLLPRSRVRPGRVAPVRSADAST